MRAVGLVMVREYLARVRTRTFLVATLGAPVIVLGLLGLSIFLGSRTELGERPLVLVDETGVLDSRLSPRLEALGFRVESQPPGEEAERILAGRLSAGEVEAALYLDSGTLSEGRAVWRGQASPPAFRATALEQAVVQSVMEYRMAEVDGELARLIVEGGELVVEGGEGGGVEAVGAEVGFLIGFGGAFLLYFVLMVYGTAVLRSVLEEKSNRIVEILISTIRPWELMLGKVLGVGAVGLTQLLIWMILGGGLLVVALPRALATMTAPSPLPLEIGALLPGPGLLALFLACFLGGYFLYSALFAVVGAVCSTEEEAQQLQLPVVLLVLIPFFLLLPSWRSRTPPGRSLPPSCRGSPPSSCLRGRRWGPLNSGKAPLLWY
jgi:ABC-2 type transport system permease protein